MFSKIFNCGRCSGPMRLTTENIVDGAKGNIVLCPHCAYPMVHIPETDELCILTQKCVDDPVNAEAIRLAKEDQEELYHKLGQYG